MCVVYQCKAAIVLLENPNTPREYLHVKKLPCSQALACFNVYFEKQKGGARDAITNKYMTNAIHRQSLLLFNTKPKVVEYALGVWRCLYVQQAEA